MNTTMGKVLAVFNTKGGVGKSTTVMMLAEAMSAFQDKRVLVVDADPQTSVSVMMTPKHEGVPEKLRKKCWDWAEDNNCTIVDYFTHSWHDHPPPLEKYKIGAVSDVEGAHTIDLIPGNMGLACFESELIEAGDHQKLDLAVQSLLQTARASYDVVLVDCPPGVTALTMLWLEHCDAFLPPTTPDYLGIRGLAVTTRLRERFDKSGRRFAPSIGTLITLDSNTRAEQARKQEIRARDQTAGITPFPRQIPRLASVQRSAEYDLDMRSFVAKYPATPNHDLPRVIQELAREVAERINNIGG